MGDMAELLAQSAPDGYWEDYDECENYVPQPKTCDYCGTKNLVWQITDNGWRLFNIHGTKHSCQAYFKDKEK